MPNNRLLRVAKKPGVLENLEFDNLGKKKTVKPGI